MKLNQKIIKNCRKPFNIILFVDTAGFLDYGQICGVINKYDITAAFFLGNVFYSDFEQINTYESIVRHIPWYGILGGRDSWDVLNDNGVYNFNQDYIKIHGVTFAGLYGSRENRNINAPILTNQQSIKIVNHMLPSDVFVTYDNIGKIRNENKGGLIGINRYLESYMIPYHLHGNTYDNTYDILPWGTISYGFVNCAILNVSQNGIKLLKQFERVNGIYKSVDERTISKRIKRKLITNMAG